MRIKIKRRIFLLLIFAFKIVICYSQNCERIFLQGLIKSYIKKEPIFNNKVEKLVKEFYNNTEKGMSVCLEKIEIKNIFLIGFHLPSHPSDINKDNFLCFLNYKRLYYDHSFIYKDSTLLMSLRNIGHPKIEIETRDSVDSYTKLIRPIVPYFQTVKPEIVFIILNIPNVYWYLKDRQLYVLTYEYADRKLTNFKIYYAIDYIHKYLKINEIMFSDKPICIKG